MIFFLRGYLKVVLEYFYEVTLCAEVLKQECFDWKHVRDALR